MTLAHQIYIKQPRTCWLSLLNCEIAVFNKVYDCVCVCVCVTLGFHPSENFNSYLLTENDERPKLSFYFSVEHRKLSKYKISLLLTHNFVVVIKCSNFNFNPIYLLFGVEHWGGVSVSFGKLLSFHWWQLRKEIIIELLKFQKKSFYQPLNVV